MQQISIDTLSVGMEASHSIYSSDGQILLREGTVMTNQFLVALKNKKISAVFVQNPILEALELKIPEVIPDGKKVELVGELKKQFLLAKAEKDFDVKKMKDMARYIADAVRKGKDISLISSFGQAEDYIFQHSLNVALLASKLGLCLELPMDKNYDLTLGALTHDIGRMFLTQPDSALSDSENKSHCEKGFNYLRKQQLFSAVSASVAYQHHENYNGTGYPRRIAKEEIHPYSRIVAICNAYAAMITDRPHRKALLPHLACEKLQLLATDFLDPELTAKFLEFAPCYPVGTPVKLHNGNFAVVVAVTPKLQTRPVLRVVAKRDGSLCPDFEEFDLTHHLTASIDSVMPEKDFYFLGEAYLQEKLAKQ